MRAFWLRVITSGHVTKMAVTRSNRHSRNSMLCFIEAKLWPIEVSHCRNMHFRPFLLLWPWRWRWPDDLHIRT